MVYKFPISIPTYSSETDSWSYTTFDTLAEFREFADKLFKEPGKYRFNETSRMFNEQARLFRQNKTYCSAPFKSKDFIKYWDHEKEKCTKGAIYTDGRRTWYLTRDYYMWLNFLPIYDKEEGSFGFAKIRDAQYHMALYELRAELHFKHCPILKKRQIASSYFHMAKLLNAFWFENGAVLKMGASREDYINLKGSWRFLTEYRDFLNKYTAWYRACTPDKVLNWQQRIEVTTPDGRKAYQGNKSLFTGTSFEKDPSAGVGGPCLLKGSLVIMSDGSYKPVEDIKIGDFVCGADGLPKRVHKLYSGESLMYKVEQTRGMTYYTTGNHILYLWDSYNNSYKKIKTKDFNLLSKNQKEVILKGKKFKGLEGFEKNLPVDPYYLGLYLGDGCKYDFTILVNRTKDVEVWDYIHKLSSREGHTLKLKNKNLYRNDYNDDMWELSLGVGKVRRPDVLKTSYVSKLRKLGLSNKHIPPEYFSSSRSQRLQLLAGILDTDGYWNSKKYRYEISIKDDRLASDITRLCVQLGLNTQVCKITNNGEKSTVYNKPHFTNRIHITGPVLNIPCKINRKKPTKESPIACRNTSTLTVSEDEIKEYYGFECEDNLFVLEDGTITHNCTYFFHEEGGIAPKADKTFFFMKPAMQSGMITTGVFIIAGSVGELDKCEPLKEMIMRPGSDFMSVTHNMMDENWTEGTTGLFIPEQWSMPPYIDEFGNSLVEEALQAIFEQRKIWKKEYSPEKYQYEVSQHPINIKEAFDFRTESVFPIHLVQKQIAAIDNKEIFLEYLDIYRDEHGMPKFKESRRQPLSFPVDKKLEDKRGCIIVHERPPENPEWGLFYASIDPVGEGKTTTSESLFCIQIYKAPLQKTVVSSEGTKSIIEGDKLVASWTGRFDDINDTHETALLLLEIYNAWALVESNVSLFIQYMILKNKQKYLVPRDRIVFLQEMKSNQTVYSPYGWKNTGTIFTNHLLSYSVEFCKEVINQDFLPDGSAIKTYYGVERIHDRWLLEEMLKYREGVNVDRLVAFSALVAFRTLLLANQGYKKTIEYKENFKESKKMYNLSTSPFTNVGKRRARNPFKNIR